MSLPRRPFSALILTLTLLPCPPSQAGATLSYQVMEGQHKTTQTVNIQDGMAWVTAAGGNKNLDLLWAKEYLVLIDHGRQRYTPINEDSVRKLAGQVETMTPLLRGLGGQIRQLKPEQRAKWEKLMDGFPLDTFDQAQQELSSARLESTGQRKVIAGIQCAVTRISAGPANQLELCLAQPDALGLSAEDANTLNDLAAFTQRLARQAHGLASRFGVAMAQIDIGQLAGIPIQIDEQRGQYPLTMTLERAATATAPLQALTIPENYRADRLKLW